MKIIVDTIDHKDHRYDTVGDYFYKKGVLYFKISKLGNENYEFLILLHELIEQFLTKKAGISEKTITKFDIAYENGEVYFSEGCDEPGNHPHSPYKKQHRFSENIERLIAHELGIDFNEYNKFLDDFWEKQKAKNKRIRIEIKPEIGK